MQVVVFDSANPDFYMAHIDLVRRYEVSQEPGPTGLPPWPDILTRLEHAPYITVGSVRGRARGVGSEFLLALDIRFASREKAVFCQPEIGIGFFPGGGGLERLPLVTGRSRAMEIINTRSHVAVGSDQAATDARFLDVFAQPEVKARIQRFMEKGGQQKDDLELNLGEHLPKR